MSAQDAIDIHLQVAELLEIYSRVTGIRFRMGLAFDRERQAFELLRAGITLAEFEMVLTHLMAKVRKGERNIGCVRWSTIVGRIDVCEEELGMAQAERRNLRPAPTPKEQALQQLRPTVSQTTTETASARQGREIAIAALEKLKMEVFGNSQFDTTKRQ